MKKTILVVDDDPEVLALVICLFSSSDYSILTAATGMAALQVSREFEGEIDLLLSDFQMPEGMSGVDLAAAMTVERPQIKVLLISGYACGIALHNDEWRFLAKPFRPSQLQASIAELI